MVGWPGLIHEDIRQARTLPASFYRDPAVFERVRERVFARSWQVVDAAAPAPGHAVPFEHVAGCPSEPLLLTRDAAGALHGLSNVCTHRGNLVCTGPTAGPTLRCGYHGRRFGLDGRFLAMPEFEGVAGFPGPEDDLARVALEALGPLLFAAVDPACSFAELLGPLASRLPWRPMQPDPAGARSYDVAANWALYCDNYLEGFHIPFVHAGLARVVEYASYATEIFPWASLQTAQAAGGEDAFDGTRTAALYAFLFPNTLLNFYPWGLSVNLVVPVAVDRTRVLYRTYVADPTRRGRGAGAALDRVEAEDEAIVEQVQRGVRARLYTRGRYSPTREAGVHHFHRLLSRALEL
jgi:choline monooxygenase